MRHRSLSAALVALTIAGLAGCGSPSHGAAPAALSSNLPNANLNGTPSAGSKATPSAPAGTPGKASTPEPTATRAPGSTASAAATGAPSASPTHNFQATPEELPIQAAVLPACVKPGSVAKLTVHTLSKASLAYVAVYQGEKSGAAPPWGEGYGGNDKGTANTHGDWSSSWTVAVNTPPGPARVILVVGRGGKQRNVEVRFAVASPTGGCDA